jgi:hypothetical protein
MQFYLFFALGRLFMTVDTGLLLVLIDSCDLHVVLIAVLKVP